MNCVELVVNFVVSKYGQQIFCGLCAWCSKSAKKEQKFDVQMCALCGRARGL